MAQNKTTETALSVNDFLDANVPELQKKADALELIRLMEEWSGFKAKMWGPSIIGFGSYHYKYASGREGDAPMLAFSPRKAQFSLYVFSNSDEGKKALEQLGKFKMAKACIYVKQLSDINTAALETLCRLTIAHLEAHHECACRTS